MLLAFDDASRRADGALTSFPPSSKRLFPFQSFKGNFTRFFNHSCDASVTAVTIIRRDLEGFEVRLVFDADVSLLSLLTDPPSLRSSTIPEQEGSSHRIRHQQIHPGRGRADAELSRTRVRFFIFLSLSVTSHYARLLLRLDFSKTDYVCSFCSVSLAQEDVSAWASECRCEAWNCLGRLKHC